MDPVQAYFENYNGTDQSDGKKPKESMDQVNHPLKPDKLGDRLKPIKCQNVNYQYRSTEQQYLLVRDGPHN
jgi:hypothetical protein